MARQLDNPPGGCDPLDPLSSPPQGRVRGALVFLLGHRRLPAFIVLLAIVLTLPSLQAGFVLDDYFHRAILLERPRCSELFGSSGEMFRFLRGDPEWTQRAMDFGFLPWWTYKGAKAEFLQFLTVQTHRLDYLLWPDSPTLMHAQSMFWFALVVAAVACFYRRMYSGAWVAGLAALLFAVEDAHATPVGWLANRNVMLAVFFGALAWIVHDLWRRDGWAAGVVVGPLLLACSLMSKEAGIATCAYLAAYALFVDRAGWLRGLSTLIPYACVVIAWRIVRSHLGYGVEDLGLYIDPLHDPARFTAAAMFRAPILLLGQWGLPPSDLAVLLPPGALKWLWIFALLFLAVLLVTFIPLLQRNRMARFWFAGMLFAVVPVCATFSMDRLLFFVGIGAFGLMAEFLKAVFFDPNGISASGWRRALSIVAACFLVAVHLILAPLLLPIRAGSPMGPGWLVDKLMIRVPFDAGVEEQDVIVVNAPEPMLAGYLPILREVEGNPAPRRTRVLAPGVPSVVMVRMDRRTLAIRPENGYLVTPGEWLLRPRHKPLSVGDRVDLAGMSVEITELTNDGRPAEAVFRFDLPLEDPALCWIRFGENGFERFTPPEVGAEMELRITAAMLFR